MSKSTEEEQLEELLLLLWEVCVGVSILLDGGLLELWVGLETLALSLVIVDPAEE